MRWILLIGLAALGIWAHRSCDTERQPGAVEDTFMGDHIELLNETEGYEDEYLDMTRQRQDAMDRAAEEAAGN